MRAKNNQNLLGGIFLFAALFCKGQDTIKTGLNEMEKKETKPISNWSDQREVNLAYPILVTEIKTLDGAVYRGELQNHHAESSKKYYTLQDRNLKPKHILPDSIKELAWVRGDRRELNLVSTFGLYHTIQSGFNDILPSGYSIALGYETSKDFLWSFQMNQYLPFTSYEIQIENPSILFLDLSCGYRFYRARKNYHTLATGLGSIFSFGDSPTYIFPVKYDYDIKLASKTGLVVSSALHIPLNNGMKPFLMLGLAYRIYSGIPSLTSKNKQPTKKLF